MNLPPYYSVLKPMTPSYHVFIKARGPVSLPLSNNSNILENGRNGIGSQTVSQLSIRKWNHETVGDRNLGGHRYGLELKLVVTSATLLVTSALLVVTRSY